MGWRSLTLLGVLAYLALLTATVPAARVYPWLAPHLEPLTLADLEGTLWRGRAGEVRYGARALGPVSWDVEAWRLVTATVETRVQMAPAGGELRGRVGYSAFDGAYVRDLGGHLAAAAIAQRLELAELNVRGRLRAEGVGGRWREGWLHGLSGYLVWDGAAAGFSQPVGLGDYRAELAVDDGEVVAAVSDTGGPLAVSGRVSLDRERRYRVRLRVEPREPLPDPLAQGLQVAARRTGDGAYRLELAGRL